MSTQAIEFPQEWIGEKVHVLPVPAEIEKEAETLAKECEADAAEAGVPIEEIVEEVGDLEGLIAAKLEAPPSSGITSAALASIGAVSSGGRNPPFTSHAAIFALPRRLIASLKARSPSR